MCIRDRERVTRIIPVKHQDLDQLERILLPFGAMMVTSRQMRVLTVSGPLHTVQAVEDAVRRLDVPPAAPKNIELTVYLVSASQQATPQDNVPKELEPVTKQLKAAFSYQGFRVLDTVILRARDGRFAMATGEVAMPRGTYSVEAESVKVTPNTGGNLIRIDKLRFRTQEPREGYWSKGFATDIDVHEGQKVVVGKANIDGSSNTLVLIVTAKVVE